MIIVIGNSHAEAIKKAADGRANIAVYSFKRQKNGNTIGDLTEREMEREIGKLGPDDTVVSVIGGNQHATLSLIQHDEPFDFFEPGSDEPPLEGHSVIPYAALFQLMDEYMRRKDGKKLQWLKQVSPCPVLHLLPPPPKEDTAHILRRFESNFAAAGILEKGVTPAPIRLKMWRLQCAVLQRICDELEIALVPPPSHTLESGYLAPQFYANDATHANETYGRKVINDLIDLQS